MSEFRLTEVPLADILATVKRIRETPCPTCDTVKHTAVDPDGEGECLRYCHGCGANFYVAEQS